MRSRLLTATSVSAGSFLNNHPSWTLTTNIDNQAGRIVIIASTTSPVDIVCLVIGALLSYQIGKGPEGAPEEATEEGEGEASPEGGDAPEGDDSGEQQA